MAFQGPVMIEVECTTVITSKEGGCAGWVYTLMRLPPLPSRRCSEGSVLTSSNAAVAGCAGPMVNEPDSGCCRPFTLTVMVPTDPACQHLNHGCPLLKQAGCMTLQGARATV